MPYFPFRRTIYLTRPDRIVGDRDERLSVGRDESPLSALFGKASESVQWLESVEMGIDPCVFFIIAVPIRPNRILHDQCIVSGEDKHIAVLVDYALLPQLVAIKVKIVASCLRCEYGE